MRLPGAKSGTLANLANLFNGGLESVAILSATFSSWAFAVAAKKAVASILAGGPIQVFFLHALAKELPTVIHLATRTLRRKVCTFVYFMSLH